MEGREGSSGLRSCQRLCCAGLTVQCLCVTSTGPSMASPPTPLAASLRAATCVTLYGVKQDGLGDSVTPSHAPLVSQTRPIWSSDWASFVWPCGMS